MVNKTEKYDFSTFKTTIGKMIGINDQAYVRNPSRGRAFQSEYSKDQAKQIITGGDIDQLISLSQYYFYASGLYRNFILYYATMLTYDTLIVPKFTGTPKNINKKKLEDKFYRSMNFIDSLNIASEFARITYLAILNGTYYGLFRDFGGRNFVIQDLPVKYCRTRFKNIYKNNVLEFDLDYFKSSITDAEKRKEALESFPPEFKKAYNAYMSDSSLRWFIVPDELGMVFFYIDQKPMLCSAIPAIIELEEYRGMEQETDKQNLQKILTQKIPLDKETNEPVFELPEIEQIHAGVVGMLRNTPNVDVLTTFADIDMHSLQDVRQVMKDNLEKIERSVYIDAGISRQIFNADGNLSLATSVKNDEAIMLDFVKQYDNWINYHNNMRNEDSKFYWDCRILPITIYNRTEMHDMYLKDAQFGYSKFLPGIAGGTKQSDIVGTSMLENEILDLESLLKPLQSSHTQSGKDGGDGGRPVKKEEEKNDKTLENEGSKDGGSNE